MSRLLASPLGDIRLRPVSASGWTAALVAAGALHLAFASGWIAWKASQPPTAEAEEDVMVTVALGPPGGRIDPEPPAAPSSPAPAMDLPKGMRTERAADAPPIAMTAPELPAPSDAALSSGFGLGGGRGAAPAQPPPPVAPPAEPVIDKAVMQAYTERVSQMIFERVRYPASALREEVQGTAIISLLIDRRGTALEVGLLHSTGHEALDDEIIAAVGRVNRFPRPPRGYERRNLRLAVRIQFTIMDTF